MSSTSGNKLVVYTYVPNFSTTYYSWNCPIVNKIYYTIVINGTTYMLTPEITNGTCISGYHSFPDLIPSTNPTIIEVPL